MSRDRINARTCARRSRILAFSFTRSLLVGEGGGGGGERGGVRGPTGGSLIADCAGLGERVGGVGVSCSTFTVGLE